MKYLLFWVFLPLVSSTYHTTDLLLTKIKYLCTMDYRLKCTYQNEIMVVDWMPNEEMSTLWVFNEHARERITAEVALNVIEQLMRVRYEHRVTIIPILNVWGRREVEEGRRCLRKNERGVDTNRNYQISLTHSYSKDSEEYEGPYPLSEKETQLVSSLLKKGVKRYINVHSGEFSMYMPYDSNTRVPPNAQKMRHFLTELAPMCRECVKGSAGKVSTYKAFGTSVDYAIQIGVPEAYTFEIYGKEAYDCDRMFNPINYKKMDHIIDMWTKILITSLTIE